MSDVKQEKRKGEERNFGCYNVFNNSGLVRHTLLFVIVVPVSSVCSS